MTDEVAKRRDQLLEAAAEADDDVLTKYLEGEEISDAELDACLHRGVRDSILAPVLVGSAAKGIGMAALLDAFIRYMPTAAEEPPVPAKNAKSGDEVTITPDPNGPLVARVFKTAADPFVGRLTYLRVLSGTLHGQGHAWNANRDEDERMGQLLLLHGKDQEPIGELLAGEIGAVAKLARPRPATRSRPRSSRSSCRRSISRSRPCRSRSSRRRRPTSTRWARRSSGCSRRSPRRGSSDRRPASSCSSRRARPTSRSSASGSSASSARRS